MRRTAFSSITGAYLVILHLFLGLLLYKTDALAIIDKNLGIAPPHSSTKYFHRQIVDYESLLDQTLPPGSVIFIGASHTESLNVGAIADHAVNYGIGGDTIADVIQRLPVYHSLGSARAIVLEVGYNDLRYQALPQILADYGRLLAALPAHVPLVLSSVLPIDEAAAKFLRWPGRNNDNILRLNQGLADLCRKRPHCRFADAGPQLRGRNGRLAPAYHVADGIHLSPAGYRIWSAALSAALQQVAPPDIARAE